MCEGLGQRLGQSFVAVNRPGANTNVGTLAAIHAKPDGHTLLMASIGLAANPSLYAKLGFDPQRDLAPIALIANVPTILVASNALPVDTLPRFIAYVKARPGELNYASYGVGSGPHLAAELFQSVTGTRIVHVPYGGGGPAALGVIGNTVQMLFSSVVPVLGMVRGGNVKAIAIASERRLALLPEVPTFKESGVDYADRHLVRHPRPGEDAGAGDRETPGGDPRHAQRPHDPRAAHRAGRRGRRSRAGAIRRFPA